MADLHYMEMGWSGSGWMDPLPTEPTPFTPPTPAPAAAPEPAQRAASAPRKPARAAQPKRAKPKQAKKKTARKAAKKATRKAAKKSVKKSAKKAARKTARKTAKKATREEDREEGGQEARPEEGGQAAGEEEGKEERSEEIGGWPAPIRGMRASFFRSAVAGLAVVSGCLSEACRNLPPDGTAVVGATLIDGSGGAPLANSVVVVRHGHIESVGTRSDFTLPPRTVEIDATGRWIIPGLIDSHAHVARWALPRYLAWGVTTVRDLHGTLDAALLLRRGVNGRRIAGPRIYSAGAMIDGSPPAYADALVATDGSSARKQVDRLVSAGADLITVSTRIDPVLLRAVLDEATAFDLPVTGHLGLTDAVTAAGQGIAAIEHLSGVPEAAAADTSALFAAHRKGFFAGWTAFEKSWATLDSASLARVAQAIVAKKVALIPTLVVHETFSHLDDPSVLQDTMLRFVPEAEQHRWDVPGMIARAGWGKADFQSFRRGRPSQDRFLRLFAAAGGTIAAGTDASNQLLVPGYSMHREMQLLVAAGLSAHDALLAATRNGALVLGVDSLGLIAPGKAADLVVLTRDPLSRIQSTLAIEQVMVRGTLYNVDSLRASFR